MALSPELASAWYLLPPASPDPAPHFGNKPIELGYSPFLHAIYDAVVDTATVVSPPAQTNRVPEVDLHRLDRPWNHDQIYVVPANEPYHEAMVDIANRLQHTLLVGEHSVFGTSTLRALQGASQQEQFSLLRQSCSMYSGFIAHDKYPSTAAAILHTVLSSKLKYEVGNDTLGKLAGEYILNVFGSIDSAQPHYAEELAIRVNYYFHPDVWRAFLESYHEEFQKLHAGQVKLWKDSFIPRFIHDISNLEQYGYLLEDISTIQERSKRLVIGVVDQFSEGDAANTRRQVRRLFPQIIWANQDDFRRESVYGVLIPALLSGRYAGYRVINSRGHHAHALYGQVGLHTDPELDTYVELYLTRLAAGGGRDLQLFAGICESSQQGLTAQQKILAYQESYPNTG